mgnify:CR=1 FL=1
MTKKISQRWGSAILAGALLLGILLGCLPALLLATASESSGSEELSVSFSNSYAVAGQELTAEVTGAKSANITYNWMVDNKSVGSGSSYTPTEADLMKWIVVTVTCDGDTAAAQMFFSRLPVVYINTENGAPITSKETYIDAELIIQGNETYNSETTKLYNGATEIRGRGNSTWSQPKKPYRLKLDKKTDLFGMGKSKHWVLLANYMDESLQRNTLAYNLSGAMGMEQMSTVFVDVVLNGDFIGNYQLCENIRVDPTRVDIFDWETFAEDCAGVIADANGMSKDETGDLETYMAENMDWITSGTFKFNGVTYAIADYPEIEIPDITGGYILELDEYYDEVSKFKTFSGQPMMFKNPEFLYTNKDMMNYVQGYVQAFEDAVQSDSYTINYNGQNMHYSDLYDMEALVDYWLVSEIFFNEEINKKSTYMYKEIDELMKMGPIWDMDWSSGADQGVSYHTNRWATLYFSVNAQANQWYKYLIQDPYFITKAQERYWEIRHDQVDDMLAELESNYALLKESADANAERWGHKSFDSYTNNLRSWFNDHLAWMDGEMSLQEWLYTSLGNAKSNYMVLTPTDTEGKALAADTAEVAPADAVIPEGQALKLQLSWNSSSTGTVVLFVNGRSVGTATISSYGTITLDVPADALTASVGEKNVLEVKISQYDSVIDSDYITVLETE